MDRCSSIEFSFKKFFNILSENGFVVGCTPMNFANKDSWETCKDVNSFKKVIEKNGFEIVDLFDNLVYKEILDVRESFEEYKVLCYVVKKNKKILWSKK